MNVLMSIIGLALAIYFAYSAGFIALFSLAGLMPIRRPIKVSADTPLRRFLVLIPSYKEDAVIENTAKTAPAK